MAKIFVNGWRDPSLGTNLLGPGYHYHQDCRSLIVFPGEIVTLYRERDRTGFKTWKLYEGHYDDLTFYGIGKYVGCIHVEQTDVTAEDLVEIGWWVPFQEGSPPYGCAIKLPPGEWTGKDEQDFPNDRIEWLNIPYGIQAECFRDFDQHGKPAGGSLIFSGDAAELAEENGEQVVLSTGIKHVKLTPPDFDWQGIVSGIKITAEDWVDAGQSIEQSSISTDSENSFAGTIRLADNYPRTADEEGELENTISQTVTRTSSDTMTENWNSELNGSATLGASVEVALKNSTEVGGGVPGVGEVKNTTELSVSAGIYGEVSMGFSKARGGEHTTTEETQLSAQISLTSKRQGTYHASCFIEYGVIRGTMVQKYRNKRTGATIRKYCEFEKRKGFQINAEVNGQAIHSEPAATPAAGAAA